MDKKVLDRISRLLALATSSNVHEAANALAAAQALMDKHKVEECMLGNESEPSKVSAHKLNLYSFTSRNPAWKWQMLWKVAKHNQCRPMSFQSEDRTRFEAGVIGTEDNAQVVKVLYLHFLKEVDRLLNVVPRSSRGRSFNHAFRLGCVQALSESLQATSQKTKVELVEAYGREATETAIATIQKEEGEVLSYMEAHDLNYKKSRGSKISSSQGYTMGYRAGKTINVKVK